MALSKIDSSSVNGLGYGFKNRIINGDMRIDQRNAGASVTPSTSWVYELDRWATYASQSSKFSIQQVSDAPSNFKNSLKVTSLSAYSITSSDIFSVKQGIEGFNFYDFNYGTSSAATFTLSFWVKSSLTGTFGGGLQNADGNRGYAFTYTVNAVNTWEYKTVVVTGDVSGTWVGSANTLGINVLWGLGVGSANSINPNAWGSNAYTNSATGATSVVGTSGATWQITGVQLEKGTVATEFDYRPYGTELALCQRYYYRFGGANLVPWVSGYQVINQYLPMNLLFPVQMRTAPTVNTNGTFTISNATGQPVANSSTAAGCVISIRASTTGFIEFYATGSTTYFDTSGAEL